jgi:hypothetical protein
MNLQRGNFQRGIAMLEAAIILTVILPVLVLSALVYEIGRLNGELREGVATALSEFHGVGVSHGRSVDSGERVLGAVADKLKREMLAYDAETVVGTLTYALTNSGDVEGTDFISVDCGVFYPTLCRTGGELRGALEEQMKSYLSEHLSTLVVRDNSPITGEPAVVTLPGRLVGVYVRMRAKGAVWRLIGFDDLGVYIDVVSPRQEVAF